MHRTFCLCIVQLSRGRWHLGTCHHGCKHIPLYPVLLSQLKSPQSPCYPGLPAQKWTLLFLFSMLLLKEMDAFPSLPRSSPSEPAPFVFQTFLQLSCCSFTCCVSTLLKRAVCSETEISVYCKKREKVLKSYWKGLRPMFEKHSFSCCS